MISPATKEQILDTARIEEVVGDFVSLKKRGANLLGLCPFHNERTPSFTVSPAKGFFKCFGCGKAGDSVTFIMEHEHLSFPEALRYLAGKYNITIEERAPEPEQVEQQNHREALFAVSEFAAKYFQQQLWESEAGKAIGLTYFRERGFSDDTIRQFGLGYAHDQWDGLLRAATEAGYTAELLEKAGLLIVQEQKTYDRFRGRVIFPVYNVTGRVIAFGARILKTDPKSPKYLNSPETEIYIKSKSLYGISLAKRGIIADDLCYLVEGYTDVISLWQSGIRNVVASSGTSLTTEQIRLIGRYTRNVTVLYDGDPAGIKASLRGIDLILEEGLNVRVVLFPKGEDPDSFSRSRSAEELRDYLNSNASDFIGFKTRLLLDDTAGDPIKKAALVRDIVETIAKVPDAITRAAYLKQTATLMDMGEQVLISELNKLIRAGLRKSSPAPGPEAPPPELMLPEEPVEEERIDPFDTLNQEREIIRVLLLYAGHDIVIPDTDAETQNQRLQVSEFILSELESDGIRFNDPAYASLLAAFSSLQQNGITFNEQEFLRSLEEELKKTAISIITPGYELADWEKHGVEVRSEIQQLSKAVIDPVIYIKKKQVYKLKSTLQEELKTRQEGGIPFDDLLEELRVLQLIEINLNKLTNTVIHK